MTPPGAFAAFVAQTERSHDIEAQSPLTLRIQFPHITPHLNLTVRIPRKPINLILCLLQQPRRDRRSIAP